MKKKSLFINFLVSIIFGLLLLYFVFQKIDLSVFFERLDLVNYSWIWLSIIISIFEHIIRAFRWNLLMEKKSDSLTTFNTTIVLIVSYFTSLIFPRFNDFVRCYLISKTNTIKLSTSLGTVISERIIDVLSLIVLAVLLLIIEYEIFVNLLIDIVDKINFDNPDKEVKESPELSNQKKEKINEKPTQKDIDIVKNAKTVFWNGPLGYLEQKPYDFGTIQLSKAIASANNFSIIGGGDTIPIIEKLGIENDISCLSTGGGSLLKYIEGEKLPILEKLGNYE